MNIDERDDALTERIQRLETSGGGSVGGEGCKATRRHGQVAEGDSPRDHRERGERLYQEFPWVKGGDKWAGRSHAPRRYGAIARIPVEGCHVPECALAANTTDMGGHRSGPGCREEERPRTTRQLGAPSWRR